MLSWHDKPGKTIAVDFDGVLHSYVSGWTGPVPEDPPVPGAVEFVRRMQRSGYKVAVLTTRARTREGLEAVGNWLVRYGFPLGLLVTCEKVPAVAYVDDRAVSFTTAFALQGSHVSEWGLVEQQISRLQRLHHGASRT